SFRLIVPRLDPVRSLAALVTLVAFICGLWLTSGSAIDLGDAGALAVATIAVVVGAAQFARAFGEIQRRGRYLAGPAAARSVAAVSGLSLCGRTEEELAVLAAAVVLVAITFWIWAVEQKDIRLNGFALSALAAGFAGVTLLAWGQ